MTGRRTDRRRSGAVGPVRVGPVVVAVLTTVLIGTAGCTPAAAPGPAPPPSSAPVPPPAAPPVLPVPPASPADQAVLDRAAAGLRPFLLAPGEVGPGYQPGAEPVADPTVPAVCGGPGVIAQFPYAVRVGAGFDAPAQGVFVQEAASVYPDPGTAQAAYRATTGGLSCAEGTVAGVPVTLSADAGLTDGIGADGIGVEESAGYRLSGNGVELRLVSARAAELVVTFVFIAPQGRTGDLPDVAAVAATGVRKLTG